MDEKHAIGVDHIPSAGLSSDGLRATGLDRAEHDVAHVVDDRLADPNLDHRFIEKAEEALENGDVKQEAGISNTLDDSPYLEVRAAVSNVDDPDMPVNTFRAWLLGLIAVVVVPGANQLLSLRYPSTTISAFVVIIFAFPLGQLLAKVLPACKFQTRLGTLTLNPGPFNVKEHALISIMCLMSYQSCLLYTSPSPRDRG